MEMLNKTQCEREAGVIAGSDSLTGTAKSVVAGVLTGQCFSGGNGKGRRKGITMAESVRDRAKRVKNACIMPGILSATVFLTSVNLFPQDGWLGFLPYGIARFFVILLCSYGGFSILKDLVLYFINGSQE